MICKSSTVIFLVLSLFSLTLSRSRNTLHKGSFLSVEHSSRDVLVSPDGTFTCGFYTYGENSFWFAIWFTNSMNKTVVWVANRDSPVNSRSSKVSLRGNGDMVLTDADGSVVWNTKTSVNITKAELLDTGNLVLQDHEGKFQWESFDYPSDTLLPSQYFTKTKKLVSSRGLRRLDTGYYSLSFDDDNALKLLYDGPDITSLYWPDPDKTIFQNGRTIYNNSRIAVLDYMGRFTSSDQLRFNASDMGYRVKRRLTIDYDGNLRLYSLKGELWEISWMAITELCKVHGICGNNSVCTYAPEPICICRPGYVIVNGSDWSTGCTAKSKRSCSKNDTFLELPHTDFYGYDLVYATSLPFEQCRQRCLDECTCEAFTYRLNGKGVCYTKIAHYNGYNAPNIEGTTYLRVQNDSEARKSTILQGFKLKCGPTNTEYHNVIYDTHNKETRWVYLYSFASALGLIEFIILVFGSWFFFRRHDAVASSETEGYTAISSQFRRFSYSELKKATKKFSNELGQGTSGVVYKGVLDDDDRIVAVKRLKDIYQGEEVFWAEVSTIGNIYHMNLVRMWGFCSDKKHRLLVYEYVENQSLDKHLFSLKFLGWKERFKVALGTAKALAYLHHECLEWIIHCDIKPENILLDSDFEPKIADFGLAKLSKRGSPISQVSNIRGTKGYMAPEWASNLPITAKVDVYSYGVVILEIVKGSRLSSSISIIKDDQEYRCEFRDFTRTMKRKIQCGADLCTDDIVDPRLNGEFDSNQVAEMVKIGMSCVEEDIAKRPTMDYVVQVLLGCQDGN